MMLKPGRFYDRATQSLITRCAIACLGIFLAVSPAMAQSPAYRERIITPHVAWADETPQRIRALCVVNYLAAREPVELAQRFPFLAMDTVPVTGNAYKNNFDEAYLTEALQAAEHDVIVIAAGKPWRDLSEKAIEALRKRVAAGTPMVIFDRANEVPPWSERSDWEAHDELTQRISTLLPVDRVSFRGKFGVRHMSVEQGTILHVKEWDNAFIHFNAFVARAIPFEDSPVDPEIYYAIAAQAIRAAVKAPAVTVNDVRMQRDDRSKSISLQLALGDGLPGDSELRWSFVSPYAQQLAKGAQPLEAGAREVDVSLPLPRDGKQLLLWRVVGKDSLLAFGAIEVPGKDDAGLVDVTLPELVSPSEAVAVKWSLQGSASSSMHVQLQIYDPDGRLVSWSQKPAAAGTLTSPAVADQRFAALEARVLLFDGDRVLDEQRLPLHVKLDRQNDLDKFHVILWGTERGSWVERNRYPLLRSLGINALAPIGIRTELARLAAAGGMRLVPTNIYGPPSRFTNMERYSRERDEERLAQYTAQIAKYSPLGYSLADEPSTSDYVAWRNRGQEIIHQYDPGALVGYCGVKLNSGDDLPGFFKAIDFLEMYSPLNLYTPDLWMGIERDKFRSFRRDDAILTSWTHYAPKRDHEPYSRTVPWLWLFEEKDGVSYFDSAGNFAILNTDLTTTHETRWWREEVLRLRQGIAEQILSSKRSDGVVRLVLLPNAGGENVWAHALNRMGIAYRFTTAQQLAADEKASLAIWPRSTQMTPEAVDAMTQFTRRGGSVIAVLPLDITGEADQTAGARQQLARVLGIDLQDAPAETQVTVARRRGVPVTVQRASGQPTLAGKTTGQVDVRAAQAVVQGQFTTLGMARRDDAREHPPFIQKLFETPAMLRHQSGDAVATTLLFEPDVDTAMSLLREHGVDTPRPMVTSQDFKAPIYNYHMVGDAGIEMLGFIADYWQAGPDLAVEGGEQTAAYFHHGPNRWHVREAQLSLPESRYVYDVRRGELLGQGDRFTIQLDPARPGLLSMLPYRVTGVSVDVPAAITAGQTLTGPIRLAVDGGQSRPGVHVVHVQLQPPTGSRDVAETRNIHLRQAAGAFSIAMPHNASPGRWTLRVTDSLTGVSTSQNIDVTAAAQSPSDMLAYAQPIVMQEPLDWPEGQWIDASEVEGAQGVRVSVKKLERKRQHSISGFQGDWGIMGGFSMSNPEISYRLKYAVSNDHEKRGWKDERRIDAPYLPGLGFRDPRPHMWYVNGYLNVFFDDVCVTAYRLSRMEKIEKDGQGRVEVTWDTPYGKIDLSFVLFADDIAMFQEMVIHPTVEFNTLELRFRSYPNGFGSDAKGTQGLREINEAGGWALLGNRDLDPAYNKGMGSGAMLILPDEWNQTEFGRGMVGARLKRVINPDAAPLEKGFVPSADATAKDLPAIQARWALWMFPTMGNAEALQYMDVTADDARRRLTELYPNRNK